MVTTNCEVFLFPDMVASRYKQATQKSTDGGNTANNALDLNMSTYSLTQTQSNPWWRVDLEIPHVVYAIKFFTSSTSLRKIKVSVFDDDGEELICGL